MSGFYSGSDQATGAEGKGPAYGPSGSPLFRRDWFWLALLFILVTGLYIPHLFQGLLALSWSSASDIIYQWIPFNIFTANSYSNGSFPLWDPHDLCGNPFLAFSHTGSLYPLGVLINVLTPFPLSTTLYILLHIILSALNMYLFLRHVPLKTLPAFMGAAAYSMSGTVMGNNDVSPFLATAAWLPLMFLGAHLTTRDGKALGFFLCAFATLFSMLGGETETLIYAIMGVLYYAVFSIKSDSLGTYAKGPLIVVLAIGSGVSMGLAQFLPLFELNHLSVRGQNFFPELYFSGSISMPLAFLGLLIYPVPESIVSFPSMLNPWYLGFIFFPFFFLSLLRNPGYSTRRLAGFFILVLAYLIFMFAPPFHSLASRVPLLSKLLVPNRFFPVIEIYFFYLAAVGIEKFITMPKKYPRFYKGLGAYFLAYGAVVAAVSLVFSQSVFTRLALAVLLFLWPFWKKVIPISVALVILFLADVYLMDRVTLPKTASTGLSPHLEIEYLIKDTGSRERYFILSSSLPPDPNLPYHLGMRIGADTIDSWSRIPPLYPARVLGLILPGIFHREDGKVTFYDQMAIRDQDKIRTDGIPVFSLLNVRWLISYLPWNPPREKIRLRKLPHTLFHIYENMDCLPRAFVVHRARTFPYHEDVRRAMEDLEFDMRNEILLAGDSGGDLSGPPASRAETVSLARPAPDRLAASVRMIDEGYLFLSESWYPGWQVLVDGEPARIERANYAFRAVRLGPGWHELNFSYRPLSFRIGLWGSIAGIIYFTGFMCFYISRSRAFSDEANREG